jgi:hypothetical protein
MTVVLGFSMHFILSPLAFIYPRLKVNLGLGGFSFMMYSFSL